LELQDFVESIRTLRQPRVSGAAGRDAVAVAEQILACIAAGRDTADHPRIIPVSQADLRKAG
jgi:hypothetical protein